MDAKYLWGGAVAIFAILTLVFAGLFMAAPTQEDIDVAVAEVTDSYASQMEALRAEFEGVKSTLESRVAELDGKVSSQADEISSLKTERDELQSLVDEYDKKQKDDDLAGQVREEGEVIDDILLGKTVSFSLDDGDLSKLFDGEIEFNEDDYNVQEKIVLSNGTYLDYSAIGDEELGANPVLSFSDEGIFSYRYEFDDVIDMTLISNDEPLDIVFLGVPMKIVGGDANGITVRSGEEYVLAEGSSLDFNGKEVTLAFVSETAVVTVCVDGSCENIAEFESESVGGLDIRVEDVLVNSRAGLATLVISDEDAVRDIDDGDDFFEDVDEWKFSIDAPGDILEAFVVSYEERRDELDDEFPALSLGDELCLPYDFACVKFDKMLYTDDYMTLDVSFEEFDNELENGTDIVDKKALLLEVDKNSGIEVLDEEVEELYLAFDGKVYYQDSNDDWFEADVSNVVIVNEDYELSVKIKSGDVVFVTPLGNVRLDTDFTNEILGLEEEDAESDDVLYKGIGYGTREYDVLTASGLIIEDVEANADNDEVVLKLPTDVVEAEVLVYG